MGSVPSTTNTTVQTAEEIINGGIMKVGVPVVTQLVTAIPALSFLRIWPLSSIFSWAVGWIAQKFSIALQILGVKLIITIQTDAERKSYSEAEGNLRTALLSGDKDAITKAKAASDAAIDSLIHYDGSAPVIR